MATPDANVPTPTGVDPKSVERVVVVDSTGKQSTTQR